MHARTKNTWLCHQGGPPGWAFEAAHTMASPAEGALEEVLEHNVAGSAQLVACRSRQVAWRAGAVAEEGQRGGAH